MDLLNKMNLKGSVSEDKVLRPKNTKDVTGSSITATVDTTPQLLKPIRPFIDATKAAPSNLSNNAQFVLNGLLSCFRDAGYIKEGIAKDILWGFQVSYPSELDKVAYGLVDLYRIGYIKFITPDGVETDENCTKLSDCWVAYTKKLLDFVHGE